MNNVPGVPDDRAAYAGFWRRFAAHAIDYVIVLLGSLVLLVAATLVGLITDDSQEYFAPLPLISYFLYCALLESSPWQATVGKRALGLKVMNRRGMRIGFARAVVRFLAKLLSVATLLLGYLLVVVTKRRQALHDLIAGTLVALDATTPKAAR
jgi:uncharacterized RDD family membrane protein YckC